MSYQLELFHSLLNEFLKGESALMTTDGDVLAVRGEQATTYGTLTTAAKVASQYLNLQEGDIALLNDPYSGGSLLSDITFVMAVSEDLLWVNRRSLDKNIKLVKSIEEEGLRIPPTPLRQKNQLNEVILSAIQAHPACPANFVEWIKQQCKELIQQGQKLVDVLEFTGFTITGEMIEEYIDLSHRTAVQKISERASGEARVDVALDSGELLRMNLDIHEGRISIDFGGTSASKTLSLTESAAYGACFHAISRFYGLEQMANSGSFSVLEITKPTGCWLVGKYPAPTYKGMTCGVAAIETAMDLALNQIHQKNESALSSHCPLSLELHTETRRTYVSLPGGQGGSSQAAGTHAQVSALSIEKLERELPVRVIRVDHRNSDGGKGKKPGGRGLLLKLEARGDITASWMTELTKHRPRLQKNCSHGDVCEVSFEKTGSTKELPPWGQQKFVAGDILTLCSGSGGGYGKE